MIQIDDKLAIWIGRLIYRCECPDEYWFDKNLKKESLLDYILAIPDEHECTYQKTKCTSHMYELNEYYPDKSVCWECFIEKIK